MWCAWVDAHDVRCLSTRELVQAFASLGIPELHVAIITRRYELCAAGVEINVIDRLVVPRVCP